MSIVRTARVLLLLTAVFVALGTACGGLQGALVGLVAAAACNANCYWRGAEIACRILDARPLPEGSALQLETMVARLAAAAAIPAPQIFIFDAASPNALAAGRDPAHSILLLSRSLLQYLTPEELEGVIAHEIAHIRARDTLLLTVSATLAGGIVALGELIALLGLMLRKEGRFGLIALGCAAAIGALLLHLALGRSREFAADRAGTELCGHPEWLADALRRLSMKTPSPWEIADAHPALTPLLFISPAVGTWRTRLLATHPPVAERIARLEAMRADQQPSRRAVHHEQRRAR